MPKSNTPEVQKKTGQKTKLKKKKFLLIILIALAVLAGLSAGAYFFYFDQPAGAASEEKKPNTTKTVDTESMDMGEMVVNLKGYGGGHYLRVKIVLEYAKEKKLSEELKKKKPQLADVIITTLRSKTLDEVSPVSAVDDIKISLIKEINKNLESGQVTSIYFTDYLVQ